MNFTKMSSSDCHDIFVMIYLSNNGFIGGGIGGALNFLLEIVGFNFVETGGFNSFGTEGSNSLETEGSNSLETEGSFRGFIST